MPLPKDLADRAEAYKQACLALDRTAATMGARAIIVTYRIDGKDDPVDLAVIGGCCMEHVVKALAGGISFVVDRCMSDIDEHDDDEEDYSEGMTIN